MDYLLNGEAPSTTRVGSIGLQYVTEDDWGFISGRQYHRTGIKAMPVEVHHFEFYNQLARRIRSSCGPCVTYVREDDTFESLAKRVSVITGDLDWENVRMAVVCVKRRPHYLSRSASSDFARYNQYNSTRPKVSRTNIDFFFHMRQCC